MVDIVENDAVDLSKDYQLKKVDFFLQSFVKERDLKLFESMLRNKHYDASCRLIINTEEVVINFKTKISALVNDKVITVKGSSIPKSCILEVYFE